MSDEQVSPAIENILADAEANPDTNGAAAEAALDNAYTADVAEASAATPDTCLEADPRTDNVLAGSEEEAELGNAYTPPKTETPEPERVMPPNTDPQAQELLNTKFKSKAFIAWTGADGNTTIYESYRSLLDVYKYIIGMVTDWAKANNVDVNAITADMPISKTHLRVYLQAEDGSKELTLADGDIPSVFAALASKLIPPKIAVGEMTRLASFLAECASLKLSLVTSVFGDIGVSGFGYISDATEVTDADVKMLVSAAEGQIDMFKDAMRKKRNIVFDGDKGQIIMPGAAGMRLVK
jgi:hypothetical protein